MLHLVNVRTLAKSGNRKTTNGNRPRNLNCSAFRQAKKKTTADKLDERTFGQNKFIGPRNKPTKKILPITKNQQAIPFRVPLINIKRDFLAVSIVPLADTNIRDVAMQAAPPNKKEIGPIK